MSAHSTKLQGPHFSFFLSIFMNRQGRLTMEMCCHCQEKKQKATDVVKHHQHGGLQNQHKWWCYKGLFAFVKQSNTTISNKNTNGTTTTNNDSSVHCIAAYTVSHHCQYLFAQFLLPSYRTVAVPMMNTITKNAQRHFQRHLGWLL